MTWLAGIAVVILIVIAIGVWEGVRATRYLQAHQAAIIRLIHERGEAGPDEIAKAVWAERERVDRLDRRWTNAGL